MQQGSKDPPSNCEVNLDFVFPLPIRMGLLSLNHDPQKMMGFDSTTHRRQHSQSITQLTIGYETDMSSEFVPVLGSC